MKITISVLLFITISLVVSEAKTYNELLADWENTKQLSEHRHHCIAESGVDPAAIDGISANAELSDAAHCFVKCLLKHLELIGDDGSVQTDNLSNMLTFEVDGSPFPKQHVIDECSKIKIGDGCDSAFEFGKCIKTHVRDAFGA